MRDPFRFLARESKCPYFYNRDDLVDNSNGPYRRLRFGEW